jgi:hypothetical protein
MAPLAQQYVRGRNGRAEEITHQGQCTEADVSQEHETRATLAAIPTLRGEMNGSLSSPAEPHLWRGLKEESP